MNIRRIFIDDFVLFVMKRFKWAGIGVILLAVWSLLSSFVAGLALFFGMAGLVFSVLVSGVPYFLISQGFFYLGKKFNSPLLQFSSLVAVALFFIASTILNVLLIYNVSSLTILKIISVVALLSSVIFGIALFRLPEKVRLRRTNGILLALFGVGISLVFLLPSGFVWDAGPIFLGFVGGLCGLVLAITLSIMFFSLSKKYESVGTVRTIKNVRRVRRKRK